MFVPKIEVTGNDDSSTIEIFDISGLFSGGATNGWGSTGYCTAPDPIVTPANVTGISIDIYDTDPVIRVLLETIIVPVGNLPATATERFSIGVFSYSHGDGNYEAEITYTFDAGCSPVSLPYKYSLINPDFLYQVPIPTDADLTICMLGTCNKLNIIENTSLPGGTPNNANGWTINPGTYPLNSFTVLTKLYIEVKDINGNVVDTIVIVEKTFDPVTTIITTLTNIFPSPHTGSFDLPEHAWSQPDGYYSFEYKVDVFRYSQPSYSRVLFREERFFYCNAQNCVDGLWTKYASTDRCSTSEYLDLEDKVLEAQLLLDGVKAGLTCLSITDSSEIIATLNKICGFFTEDCGCNK